MNKEQFLEWLGPSAKEGYVNDKDHMYQIFYFRKYTPPYFNSPVSFEILDERFLGEGDWGGDQWIVYRFDCEDGPLWVKFSGFYRSYNYGDNEEYTSYKVVTPQEKLVTVYE